MPYIFLFILMIVAIFPSAGQKKWDLPSCINQALTHNISLQQQTLILEEAAIQLKESKLALLPNLNGGASASYNTGRVLDKITNTFTEERVFNNNLYISSSITVFNGFQLLNQIKKSQLNITVAQLQIEEQKNSLILSVITAYMQVLYQKESVKAAENQYQLTQEQLKKTQELIQAGALPSGEIHLIQAQLASEEVVIIETKNQEQMGLLTLQQLLDLNEPSFDIISPSIAELPTDMPALSLEDIQQKALTVLPELKVAEQKKQLAEQEMAIRKGAIYPSLSLYSSIGTGYSAANYDNNGQIVSFNQQFADNFNQPIGLNISIPIFNGHQTTHAIARAKINLLSEELNITKTKNQVIKEVQQTYLDTQGAWKKYIATQKNKQALEASYSYSKEKFNAGTITSYELNQVKNQLVKAISEQLTAKYEFTLKQQLLAFYQGQPIQ